MAWAREGLRELFFGATWVYTRLRPRFFGGLDYAPVYAWLEAGDDDVIVDVGSGFGDSLRYLDRYHAYHGFDVKDPDSALGRASLDAQVAALARALSSRKEPA